MAQNGRFSSPLFDIFAAESVNEWRWFLVFGFWSATPFLHLARPLSHMLPIAGRLLPRVDLRSFVPSLSACHTTLAAFAPNVSNSSLFFVVVSLTAPTGRNAVRGEKEGSVWKVYRELREPAQAE